MDFYEHFVVTFMVGVDTVDPRTLAFYVFVTCIDNYLLTTTELWFQAGLELQSLSLFLLLLL